MIKAGIIGGAGYTAGELIRLLINHPDVDIKFINSSSNAGNKITDVHEGLYGETDLVLPTNFLWMRLMYCSSVRLMEIQRSLWIVTMYPRI